MERFLKSAARSAGEQQQQRSQEAESVRARLLKMILQNEELRKLKPK